MLHLFNKNYPLDSYLKLIQAQDELILMENGVNLLLSPKLHTVVGKIYVLESDLKARGLQDKLLKSIKPIDFAEFVYLTTQHKQIYQW